MWTAPTGPKTEALSSSGSTAAALGRTTYVGVAGLASVGNGFDNNSCLLANRFRVEVTWTNQHGGNATGTGKALPGTDQTTYFWFFNRENTELVLKMVDGRTLNDHFWVFHGGLSDVDYVIKVTDTVTGAVRTYHNPAGSLTSEADTSAF